MQVGVVPVTGKAKNVSNISGGERGEEVGARHRRRQAQGPVEHPDQATKERRKKKNRTAGGYYFSQQVSISKGSC